MALQILGNGGVIAEVDANTRALLVTPRPLDIGSLGAFRWSGQTGTVAAGAAALAPWFSFRWTTTNVCILREVRVGLQALTGFTAGNGLIDMIVARSFSVSDSGGTASAPTGNSNKKKTSHATTTIGDLRIASTAALSAGTRTLDGAPAASVNFTVNATANSVQLSKTEQSRILNTEVQGGEWPFIFAQNEGFILRATVPATGTWNAFVDVEWEERTAYP